MFRIALCVILLSFPALATALSARERTPSPVSKQIESLIKQTVDVERQSVGIVVGVIDGKGTHIVGYGAARDGGSRPDGDTVFEIGSVTKIFTCLLLADMARSGDVSLQDQITKHLPPGVTAPVRYGKSATLENLATHTSGLPRMPRNFFPKDNANPYADYTVQDMYDALAIDLLLYDIGSRYEYSNFGIGLLGHLLSRASGKDYETLLTERICLPLGLRDTRVTLSPELQARLAQGHNDCLKPVRAWESPTLVGAIGLHSTVNDLLKLLAVNLRPGKSPLAPAILEARRPRAGTNVGLRKIGLGWNVNADEVVWHDGNTGGYSAFIGFDESKRRGVVVLSNSSQSVYDIGFLLCKTLCRESPTDEKSLDAYVGLYELSPDFTIKIFKDGGKLMFQGTTQPPCEMFPESETVFFLKSRPSQILFSRDENGKVSSLTLHQNGSTYQAQKTR
jgi:CubicO group peptidase (beta-lactamase class C family)